jgi:quinol monooxygenase YgiN
MFVTWIKIAPPAGSRRSVIDILQTLQGPLSAITDCLDCSILSEVGQDAGQDGWVCYVEKWRTREALGKHLRSVIFNRVLEAMECSRQPPEVGFFEMTEIGDLNLIEQARTAP